MGELYVHEACNTGKLKFLTDLIEAGADPNEVDGATGSLPLHWAARSCRFECAEYVVNKKLNDLNAKNNDGNTPLHYATISGSKKITALLLENGADINAINKNGQTPLHGAVSQSWEHVVEYLGSFKKAECKECQKNKCSKHALDVNAQDKNGQTALHVAGDLWSNTVYAMLLRLGAVETIKDDRGDFPKSSKLKWWEFTSQTTPVLALLLAVLVSYLYYRWDDLMKLRL